MPGGIPAAHIVPAKYQFSEHEMSTTSESVLMEETNRHDALRKVQSASQLGTHLGAAGHVLIKKVRPTQVETNGKGTQRERGEEGLPPKDVQNPEGSNGGPFGCKYKN